MQNPFRFATLMLGQGHHPVLTYSSQIHQTSPRSHHHHHSGRCPRCSVHMHTGTPPSCRWQLEHLMLTRESKKKCVRWQGSVQFGSNLLSLMMSWQVFSGKGLEFTSHCCIALHDLYYWEECRFCFTEKQVKPIYKDPHADNPVNTIKKKSYIGY